MRDYLPHIFTIIMSQHMLLIFTKLKLGNNKGIYDCKVRVLLDNIHKEHALIEGYLGIMENNN